MDKFIQLKKEAEELRNSISTLYNLPNSNKIRLQRIFDKATKRIIRRMSYIWLLEYAHNLPVESEKING